MLPGDPCSALPSVSRAAARAGGASREALWGCVASKALHLAAAAGLYVLAETGLLSYSPPSGEASIELTAVFPSAAAPRDVSIAIQQPESDGAPDPLANLSTSVPLARSSASGHVADFGVQEVAVAPDRELPPVITPSRSQPETRPQDTEPGAAMRELPRISAAPPQFELSGPSASQPESRASAGAQADSLPLAAFQPAPVYPPELERAGIEGTVVFRLKIAADGSVAEAVVEQSSGYAAMDRAALVAVRKWRFTPARRLGVAVPVEVRKRFPFVIER